MEKRIRIIWILSLVSVALLTGVQGYWLFNQYQYVTTQYLTELGDGILKAGDEEFRLRKENKKVAMTFIMDRNTRFEQNDSTSLRSERVVISRHLNDSLEIGKFNFGKELPPDAKVLSLSWDTDISNADMHTGIDRAVVNYNNPFRTETLDSILRADMPDFRFRIVPRAETDTSVVSSYWEKAGSLLNPRIHVSYAYSPFQKMGVHIYADIPQQPLLRRMAIQLTLAVGLVILLIGCLVFQVKTILRQKKLSELRESFVHTMIHELKRPVQTLKAFITYLGDKDLRSDEDATRQVLQDSRFELDNLSAYLGKLRDMVRADNEQTPLHPSLFNLEELVGKVIRLANIPPDKQVNISATYEMESPRIEADPVHIANILGNLIENAVKYSAGEVDIRINARRKGRELWLTVTDNGIGIPFAEQEKVFAKFYRATNIPDRNIPGLGLGLSYVKMIAEAHHGRVSLESHTGRGTAVTLFLPQ